MLPWLTSELTQGGCQTIAPDRARHKEKAHGTIFLLTIVISSLLLRTVLAQNQKVEPTFRSICFNPSQH
jgi:hypothetical protein